MPLLVWVVSAYGVKVLAELEAGREGQGRLLTKRVGGTRWAVFLRPGW